MSDTLVQVLALLERNDVRISDHGYEELAADDIYVKDILHGAKKAIVVEEYPKYQKGPCVLVLQKDRNGNPVHVVWGIPSGASAPAVLVTAYRPEPKEWTEDFLRRRL